MASMNFYPPSWSVPTWPMPPDGSDKPKPLAAPARAPLNPEEEEAPSPIAFPCVPLTPSVLPAVPSVVPSVVHVVPSVVHEVPSVVQSVVPEAEVHRWTEWEITDQSCAPPQHSTTVTGWRFKHANREGLQRLFIQTRLFGGDTETHVVPLEQLKIVRMKCRGFYSTPYRVELDMTKWAGGGWSPVFIGFNFWEEDNGLAFQGALVDFLAAK